MFLLKKFRNKIDCIFKILWKLVSKGAPFNPTTRSCPLCLREKFFIIFRPEGATLSSRQTWEKVRTCGHCPRKFCWIAEIIWLQHHIFPKFDSKSDIFNCKMQYFHWNKHLRSIKSIFKDELCIIVEIQNYFFTEILNA